MKRILIAEDDTDLADILREALTERLDVEVIAIANGALVMDSVTAQRPDLLVLDVGLPGLNGLDVFDLLRSDPHGQAIPVLFLTAVPEEAATASTATGVNEVLAKPFDIDDLISRADRLLNGTKTTEIAA